MKTDYQAIVNGGGVVGASVLYHLAKFGWTDICLLERSVLRERWFSHVRWVWALRREKPGDDAGG
jgi:glycine/D-amino acid oxidase-like deaminating enzyme